MMVNHSYQQRGQMIDFTIDKYDPELIVLTITFRNCSAP